MANEMKYTLYRDKPLVRGDGQIIYGDMKDPYYLQILIMSMKKAETGEGGTAEDVPDQMIVQILSTDRTKPESERMVKQFFKSGLFEALDIGVSWLERFNREALGEDAAPAEDTAE